MIDPKDIIQIGSLVRTHGKAGEMQCRTINTYWEEADADFIFILLDAIPTPFRVIDWRSKGEDLLLTLKGVSDENQALRLVGNDVYMLRRDIVAEDEAVLCWQDLVGYSLNGCTIVQIDDSTANILAQLEDGRLIPLHEDLITDINHNSRTITMNLPDGL
ncbi:MAG: hypothetical protein MJZ75_01200 [Paludibacteraceae bacterium]|nr:hypothetical protein [Paludibacteraceae bacterium]